MVNIPFRIQLYQSQIISPVSFQSTVQNLKITGTLPLEKDAFPTSRPMLVTFTMQSTIQACHTNSTLSGLWISAFTELILSINSIRTLSTLPLTSNNWRLTLKATIYKNALPIIKIFHLLHRHRYTAHNNISLAHCWDTSCNWIFVAMWPATLTARSTSTNTAFSGDKITWLTVDAAVDVDDANTKSNLLNNICTNFRHQINSQFTSSFCLFEHARQQHSGW